MLSGSILERNSPDAKHFSYKSHRLFTTSVWDPQFVSFRDANLFIQIRKILFPNMVDDT